MVHCVQLIAIFPKL